MASIRLEGLVVGRGARALTPPLDIALDAGEALVITGPNGAGKSTLLRVLAGLVPAMAGRIAVTGLAAADGEPARHPHEASHYIGHRNGLKPHQSAIGNLRFWGRYLGGQARRDAAQETAPEAALAALGLAPLADLPVGYLSAGQQRRVALCRLLVAPRKLWLLDEPVTALDTAAQDLFAAVVARHLGEGGMVVAATHQSLAIAAARRLDLAPLAQAAPGGPAMQGEDWEW